MRSSIFEFQTWIPKVYTVYVMLLLSYINQEIIILKGFFKLTMKGLQNIHTFKANYCDDFADICQESFIILSNDSCCAIIVIHIGTCQVGGGIQQFWVNVVITFFPLLVFLNLLHFLVRKLGTKNNR